MNMDKWKSILGFVSLDNYPNLPCPYCQHEALNIEQDSIVSRMVSDNYKKIASRHFDLEQVKLQLDTKNQSKQVRELFESQTLIGVLGAVGLVVNQVMKPNHHFCKFTAFMVCGHCSDNVAVTGLSQEYTKKTTSEIQLPSIYKIDHFSIPIPMFSIHSLVPVSIQFELLGAFSYFHVDTSSSANKLRRAIEKFCAELGVEGNNLGRQIEQLKKSHSVEADLLNTLRLVGNEGTHSDGVLEDDLLMAFDIVEEVLTIFPRLDKLKRLKAPQAILSEKFDKKKAQIERNTIEHLK
jgi:hypothetical protein